MDKKNCKLYKNDKMLYTDWLILWEKNKTQPRLEEIKNIEKIMEGINKKKLNEAERMKEKYTGKGSLPKADRITVAADSEHVGEKLPFYNTYKKEGEEAGGGGGSDDEGGKKKKKENFDNLFHPHKKAIWHRDPSWKMYKPLPKNEDVQERFKSVQNEKLDKIMQKFEEKKINLVQDVTEAFTKNKDSHKRYHKYVKDLPKSEQYVNARKENPPKHPGPQNYFKTPIQSFAKKEEKGWR